MRILIIYNEYLYRGGEDVYIESLIKLLKNKGNEVYYYKKSSKTIFSIYDKLKAALGLFYNPIIDKEISKVIDEFKPDIAHFHNIFPLIGATAYRICKKYKIPVVQHIHNYRFVCPKANLYRNGAICELCPVGKNLLPALLYGCYAHSRIASLLFVSAFYFHKIIQSYELVDSYIFPSEFTRQYFITHLNLDKKKTHYLPLFSEISKSKINSDIKEINYYLYVGRLSREKGILNLLDAFKKGMERLVVIGDGPLKKYIYDNYSQFKTLTFLPFQNKSTIKQYIKSSKAVIIPSECYETSSLIIIESYMLKKLTIFPLRGGMLDKINMGIGYDPSIYLQNLKKIAFKKIKISGNYYKKKVALLYRQHNHYRGLIRIYLKLRN